MNAILIILKPLSLFSHEWKREKERNLTRILIWRPQKEDSFSFLAVSGASQPDLGPSEYIRLASDTRITSSRDVAITDNSNKLLSLKIRLSKQWNEDESGFPRKAIVHEGDVGFAFAGNVSAATATYSYVSSVFHDLLGWEHDSLPTPFEIADFIARVGTRFVREAGVPFGKRAVFEAAVLVQDPSHKSGSKNATCVFHLKDAGEDQYRMIASPISMNNVGDLLVLGGNRERATRELKACFAKNKGYNPVDYLSDEIARDQDPFIGGYIYQAIMDGAHFDVRPLVLMCEHGKPRGNATKVGSFRYATGRSGDWLEH